ncbi:hypothetical protein EKPJFOCH_4259 [Methylobacterium thuringiense]|uniref:Uncharacterized protein n=1 Tax=Methylobacterium thuringiense TaxID=1003091 RepID=A0ABQ4TSY4_9HYPH|nr:hypothetical protein EKPJFOCH_4259 [Methylobacterium thuringiense]
MGLLAWVGGVIAVEDRPAAFGSREPLVLLKGGRTGEERECEASSIQRSGLLISPCRAPPHRRGSAPSRAGCSRRSGAAPGRSAAGPRPSDRGRTADEFRGGDVHEHPHGIALVHGGSIRGRGSQPAIVARSNASRTSRSNWRPRRSRTTSLSIALIQRPSFGSGAIGTPLSCALAIKRISCRSSTDDEILIVVITPQVRNALGAQFEFTEVVFLVRSGVVTRGDPHRCLKARSVGFGRCPRGVRPTPLLRRWLEKLCRAAHRTVLAGGLCEPYGCAAHLRLPTASAHRDEQRRWGSAKALRLLSPSSATRWRHPHRTEDAGSDCLC